MSLLAPWNVDMCLAVPGRLTAIDYSDPAHAKGRVDFGGVRREVSLALLPEARVGDWLIIHAGLAISVLDQAEAEAALAEFAGLDALPPEPGA